MCNMDDIFGVCQFSGAASVLASFRCASKSMHEAVSVGIDRDLQTVMATEVDPTLVPCNLEKTKLTQRLARLTAHTHPGEVCYIYFELQLQFVPLEKGPLGPRRPLESSLGCAHTAPTFCQHCAQAVPALCPLFAHKSRLCPHFAPLFAHAVSTLCLHATHALLIHHCSFVYPFITVDLLAQEVVRTSPPLC